MKGRVLWLTIGVVLAIVVQCALDTGCAVVGSLGSAEAATGGPIRPSVVAAGIAAGVACLGSRYGW